MTNDIAYLQKKREKLAAEQIFREIEKLDYISFDAGSDSEWEAFKKKWITI